MTEQRPILVATDLSEAAAEALRQASRWATATGSPLVVLYALPEVAQPNPVFPNWALHVAEHMKAAEAAAKDEVRRQLRTQASLPEAQVEIAIAHGNAQAAIVREAEQRHARLVVVGSHGYTGLKRILLGSVAEKVVRHAHCPVLIAREGPRTSRVLCATDFSAPAAAAIDAALEAAKVIEGRLTLAHALDFVSMPSVAWANSFPEPMASGLTASVFQPPEEVRSQARADAEQKLRAELFRRGLDGQVLVEEGAPGRALVLAAERMGAELVVVGTAGRTGLARLALGSVAESVARTAHCSVLVARTASEGA
ncbi:MAG: universal stress protein [Myxococcales bacterium]